MPLLINLQELEDHDKPLCGELPSEEVEFDIDDDVTTPAQTLMFELNAHSLPDALLVRGKLHLDLHCKCVRCMEPFLYSIDFPDWICHIPTEGEDKAPIIKGCVDLTPYIREDMLLAFPQHPLCRENCPGLLTKDSKKSEDSSDDDGSSSPWDQLNQLKL